MEPNWWELLIAFWLSGAFVVTWNLWWPSFRFMKKIAPQHPACRHWYVTVALFYLMTIVGLPLLVVTLGSEKYRDDFILTYVAQLLEGKK